MNRVGSFSSWRRFLRTRAGVRFTSLVIGVPLLVAALSYSAFFILGDLKLFYSIVDDAHGRKMSLFADTRPPMPGARPIVILDFDDATMRGLGDPALVPPYAVSRSLRRLAAARPWAVVVDIDTSYLAEREDIAALTKALQALRATGSHVVLVRDVLPPDHPAGFPRLRPTPLAANSAKMGLIWATTLYPGTYDGAVRKLFRYVRVSDGGREVVIPSVMEVLSAFTGKRVGPVAAPSAVGRRQNESVLIDFSMSWPPRSPEAGFRVAGRPLVNRVPASPMLGDGEIEHETFRGALVILAATAHGRDLVQTPVGEMPGAYVIANSARGVIELGEPAATGYLSGLAITVTGALVLSLVAHFAIVLCPARFQFLVESQLPAALTALLWLAFYLTSSPNLSVSLVATAYLVIMSVVFAHRRARRRVPVGAGSGAAS